MDDQDLAEAEENLTILIGEELAVQHQFDGHPEPVAGCAVCRAHTVGR
jgi:hypothetical protein